MYEVRATMKDPFVVLSDPPQPAGVDLPAAALVLGLQLIDARGKLGYGLPDVWAVTEKEGDARKKADELASAKVRCEALR